MLDDGGEEWAVRWETAKLLSGREVGKESVGNGYTAEWYARLRERSGLRGRQRS